MERGEGFLVKKNGAVNSVTLLLRFMSIELKML